jgi:hypothetical protein
MGEKLDYRRLVEAKLVRWAQRRKPLPRRCGIGGRPVSRAPVPCRWRLLLAAVLLLAACASDKPKPTPLENYAKIAGRQVWSQRGPRSVAFR